MPLSALRVLKPDFTVPLNEIGPLIRNIVQGEIEVSRRPAMAQPVDNTNGQEEGLPVPENLYGTPTAFSCPDCNGTLWELQDGGVLRYRCRVGHAYSARSMVEAESEAVERAMWEAVRVLEESVSISRRIAERSDVLREHLLKKAVEREGHAQVLRDLLVRDAQ
jgi:two-component system chemotaxis response regulator CheB